MEKNSSDNKKSQQRFKTTRVVKEEESHSYEQGVKGGKCGSSYGDGVSKSYNGFGGVSTNTASGLYVGYKSPVRENELLVSIKKDFADAGIWRITQKVLKKIQDTMPEFIYLEERDGRVCVDLETITKWIERVKNLK